MTETVRARFGTLIRRAQEPVDAAGAAAFRVLFGLLCFVSTFRLEAYGWVDDFFVTPTFHFKYAFAPFVERLAPGAMHGLVYALMALSLLMAAGLFTRLAASAFFLGFSYLLLIDVTNYVNHYYLVCVLALWMALLPMGRAYSLDAWRQGSRVATMPRFVMWCLRLQIGMVYTFAGIAKLGPDWLLAAQPLDIWFASRSSMPVIGPVLAHPFAPHVMAWAGCLFDLLIPWLLLTRRTRALSYAALLGFHVLTKWMLPYIGMFPFIMTVAATVFFDPSWPRRITGWLWRGRPASRTPGAIAELPTGRGLALAAGLLLCTQLLIPLRAFAYGGNVLWHEQGMRFSWRVVVREKSASVTYLVKDSKSGRTTEVSPRSYLDRRQAREFAAQPDLIVQLAKRIAKDRGPGVEVYADVVSSLNGRAAARLIDPTVDLAALPALASHRRFILDAPLTPPPFLHGRTWQAVTLAP